MTKDLQDQLYAVPHDGQHDAHHEGEEAAVDAPYETVEDGEADVPLRADVTCRDNGCRDDEVADDDDDHSLPDAESETEKTGRGGPSANVEAREDPVADGGPGAPCAAGRRERDDVAVDPRGRLTLVLLVLDLELLENA